MIQSNLRAPCCADRGHAPDQAIPRSTGATQAGVSWRTSVRTLIQPEQEIDHATVFGKRFVEYVYVENGTYTLRNTAWYMEQLCRRVAPSGDLLHVGCGFGINPLIVAQNAKRVRSVQAIDPDVQKIEVFQKLIAATGATNVAACTGIGEDLPYDNASFDWIICNECISHVDSIPAVLAEMHRVLRSSGRLLISDTACWNPYALWFKYGRRHLDENYQSKRRMRRYLHAARFHAIDRIPGLVAPRNPWRSRADQFWWLHRWIDPKYVLMGVKP